MKSCSCSIENMNTCSRLLTLPHTSLLTCKTLNMPSTCFSPGRHGQVTKSRPTQIPEEDIWCTQRTLRKIPLSGENNFHSQSLFCSQMCICKNTTEELKQLSCNQEGTRLRKKFLFWKSRRRKKLKDPRPLGDITKQFNKLEWPSAKLYYIPSNKDPYFLGHFKFDTVTCS